MPANNNTSLYWQRKAIQRSVTNKGPLTVEQGPKFIMRWVINSILWIASQCLHPGTIDDIQPTWLNPISNGDGWSWAHLPCNHIIAVGQSHRNKKVCVLQPTNRELGGWNNATCWKWLSSTRNDCRYFLAYALNTIKPWEQIFIQIIAVLYDKGVPP